jgi:putative restriction endonuclease
MAIKLVVAVTDSDWFEHLRGTPNLSEVNFWAPSASSFRALAEGELFLFKLHAPRNFIVGGGVFVHATILPCSLAWASFGEANGAVTLREMRQRIMRYRNAFPDDRSDFAICCRVLTQPFFLEEPDWIPAPPSWSKQIMAFKTYSTDEADGQGLWEAVSDRITPMPTRGPGLGERFGAPQLITPRLGQGAFRLLVTDSYNRRCAVTRERTLPALEAAHIRPYGDGGEHAASNGLLLRRDIHNLFDLGHVTVSPDLHFEVSRRIREEFENGRDYYALHGQRIAAPDDPSRQPDPQALAWHREQRFNG